MDSHEQNAEDSQGCMKCSSSQPVSASLEEFRQGNVLESLRLVKELCV